MSRECDCPWFVERCVHVDGYRVWLINAGVLPGIAAERGITPHRKTFRHSVCVGTWDGYFENAGANGLRLLPTWPRSETEQYHHDYAAALAGFHEAETRLLAGLS